MYLGLPSKQANENQVRLTAMIDSHLFAALSLWMETPCFIIGLNLFLHLN